MPEALRYLQKQIELSHDDVLVRVEQDDGTCNILARSQTRKHRDLHVVKVGERQAQSQRNNIVTVREPTETIV